MPEAPVKPPRPDDSDPVSPPPVYPDPVVLIHSAAELEALVHRLEGVACLAVDLEADSLYHYFEKVCLLQLTAGGTDYIIDPFLVTDLSPLKPIFADPSIQKIFHSAENDMAQLVRSFGIETVGIFDTMVAAQIAGHRRFGLGELVRHYFQVGLDKRFQRHDWSSRPLEEQHLHYARSDTHYLEALRDHLWARIEALGRTEQAREELELAGRRRLQQKAFSPDDCLKLTGAQDCDPRALRVLRELFVLRDTVSRAEDLPPFRIMPNEVLLLLARRAPVDRRALADIRGVHGRLVKRVGNEIVQAVQRGLASGEPPPQYPPRPMRPANATEIEARFQKLRQWRTRASERLDLDPAVVASNSILYAVAQHAPTSLEQLRSVPHVRSWQVASFGTEWLTTMSGR